ncbi:arf-GAP with SH3 domain, ANK repeat and PH domain-containing protein 1 isoform X1 [Tachysurus ichikawai]
MPDQISVSEFLSEATEDYNSPTTSSFTTRLQSCRNSVSVLEEVRAAKTSPACVRVYQQTARSIKKKDASCLDKLVRKTVSVVGTELDSLTFVAERWVLNRLLSIMDKPLHPMHSIISMQFQLHACSSHCPALETD